MNSKFFKIVMGSVILAIIIFGAYFIFCLGEIVTGLILIIFFGGVGGLICYQLVTKLSYDTNNMQEQNQNQDLMRIKDFITDEYGHQYIIFALIGQSSDGDIREEGFFAHTADFDERDLSKNDLLSINMSLLSGHEQTINYNGMNVADVSDIPLSEFKSSNGVLGNVIKLLFKKM